MSNPLISRRSKFSRICLFLIASIVFLQTNYTFLVAEASESSDIGFYVKAQLPDNQRDTTDTFFNLRMQPKQQQTLEVLVSNTSTDEMQIEVEANNAYTNRAGGVDYRTPGIKDENAKYSLEDIAKPRESLMMIPPGKTIPVLIDIIMPEDTFDGIVLGGIVISKSVDESKVEEDTTIINKYSYVVGIILNETDTEVVPRFDLVDVKPDLVNHRTAIVNTIRNFEPVLIKNASLYIEVYPKGSDTPIWSHTKSDLKMAPCSVMDYTFYLEEETITPGDYVSKVEIVWQDLGWNFEKEFTIESENARNINENSVTLTKDGDSYSFFVNLVLIFVLIAVFALIIFLIVRIIRSE